MKQPIFRPPTGETVEKAVDALVGLAAFPAEQVLAMSLSKSGLDFGRPWDRKCQAGEQTPGLTIWRGGETFDQIGGCENIKRFLNAFIHGEEARPVSPSSWTRSKRHSPAVGRTVRASKTEMTGTMLSWMQDRGADDPCSCHRDVWPRTCNTGENEMVQSNSVRVTNREEVNTVRLFFEHHDCRFQEVGQQHHFGKDNALMGTQRANAGSICAIWAIQDRIALDANEEKPDGVTIVQVIRARSEAE